MGEKDIAGRGTARQDAGLLGLGRVGAEVARRAKALDMKVLAHDPYVSPERAEELGVSLLALPDLLAQADYVSLHTALSPATDRLMNAQTLGQMKRGARLVNTARGELVDEAALVEALKSAATLRRGAGRISVERLRIRRAANANVITTPHVADRPQRRKNEVGVRGRSARLSRRMARCETGEPASDISRSISAAAPYLELTEGLASSVAQAAPFAAGRVDYNRGRAIRLGSHVCGARRW